MYPKIAQYTPLEQSIDEPGDSYQGNIRTRRKRWLGHASADLVGRTYLVAIHFVLALLAWLLLDAHWKQQELKLHMLPSEFVLAKEAVRYEEITFDPSGFWEDPSRATPYEGPPTAKVNAAWKHLNYLRKRAYGIVPEEAAEHGQRAHLAHCVDYLRQVLMCHGDLTPITLRYNQSTDFVEPNFRIRHTCRNFDMIWEFAAKGNRSGISIEGRSSSLGFDDDLAAAAAAAVETCGTSPQDAVSRGCRFDVMSFAWLPAPCFDGELMADFLALRDWRWYVDPDGTQMADAAAAARGEYDRLYVTQEYHMYHCTYMWRKMHRAIRYRRPLDGYIANMEHTAHCEAMLVNDAGLPLDATNTAIVSKYVQCPVSGQELGDAGWYRMVDGARVHGFGRHHHHP
ncbi:hypothetical protein B0H66DRAFT_485102 [Apodospora peruviana]|uniref:Uncharacterized protein n=1 Tax=Apodospora peruviana TaxID=516989 RepID=A0AAE0HVZ1_9PEZI|nr:hypothetical protein B0H66DRAFT_485102 [Apodospora peruviana]